MDLDQVVTESDNEPKTGCGGVEHAMLLTSPAQGLYGTLLWGN